ncbi:MAG: hypothetical protein ABIG08_01975 [bacterium]
MDQKIKEILNDLYAVDSTLRQEEEKIVKIVEKLLLAQPEVKIDENFISQLRLKLLEKEEILRKSKTHSFRITDFIPLNKLAYAFSGVAVALLLIVGFIFYSGPGEVVNVQNIGNNAFGNIVFSGQSQEGDNLQGSAESRGLGGGGGEEIAPLSSTMGTMGKIVPPDYYVNYKYVYRGGDFKIEEEMVDVYRRIKDETLSSDFASIIKGFNFGAINLEKFQNIKINNLQISEDHDFGYSLYVDFQNNSLSIYANWEKWPRTNYEQLSESDILPDKEVIAIADSFLKKYNIDMSGYAKGEVINPPLYRTMDMAQPEGAQGESLTPIYPSISIPDTLVVVYPVEIDGKIAHHSNGEKEGLTVSVSLRYKKVTHASSIMTGSYESSKYKAETEKEKIIAMAEKGGLFGSYYVYPDSVKTIEIPLGMPKLGLVKTWQWTNGQEAEAPLLKEAMPREMSYELYVPAFIFPVLENPESSYYRQNVIVPLVGDIMNGSMIREYPLGLSTETIEESPADPK